MFVLRELEEVSGADVAETLGLTQEAVRVRLHRARNAMRELRIVASVLARLT